MLSALISSAGRKPAMLLAEQLAHESCVRPGPLVLGTALLKSPTPTEDRDRHDCYRRRSDWVSGARSFLPDSACRHAARTVSSRLVLRALSGVQSLRVPAATRVFPADCPHPSRCHCRRSRRVARDARSFQQIARFIDSEVHCLTTF